MSGTVTGARAPAVEVVANVYPRVLPPAVLHNRVRGSHLNASVVVVVVILSVVLVLSGLLHLLARCLGRRRQRGRAVSVREQGLLVSALHGQLQQLFHLHDAGVEQAFIDTLPVFCYGSIRGLKDSTDCAVCLMEFGDADRLRLLPKCKHAFHVDCIDTWLLSNSTCPLCRRTLLPDAAHFHVASSSSRHRHSGRLVLGDDSTAASTSVSSEEQLLQHPNTSRRTPIASLHESYRTSFRICNEELSNSEHNSHRNEIQEIEEVQALHELENDVQYEVEEILQQIPSPFAPTIRVMDLYGTQRVLKVELGRVASHAQSDSRKLTAKGARSYSMGSYEYIVDSSSWELRIAPTPYPGRPQDWAPSKPTHRTALSDSIPELASAGSTPANDELFWVSRGLYNPHTLSRIRELLTPSGSEGFSPFMDFSLSPAHGDRWIDVDIDSQEIVKEGCISSQGNSPQESSNIQQRSSSLSRLPSEAKASVRCFRRSFSETSAGMEQAAKGGATALCAETLTHQGSLSRRFSLNWLMGRDKRMVFAAASPVPVPVPDVELPRSTSVTI